MLRSSEMPVRVLGTYPTSWRSLLSVANCNSAAVDLVLTDLRRSRRGVMFSPMREWLILVSHLVVTIIKIAAPGGARSVVAESLILKHQLLILNRSRKRAPRLGRWTACCSVWARYW